MTGSSFWLNEWWVRGSGWLALTLLGSAWVWGHIRRKKAAAFGPQQLGLTGACLALTHGLLSLASRLEWDLGHLWVQPFLRLGGFAWLWLMLLSMITFVPPRFRRYLPWHPLLRSLLGLLLLTSLAHALLAPFSSVRVVLLAAAFVVGFQVIFWIRLALTAKSFVREAVGKSGA